MKKRFLIILLFLMTTTYFVQALAQVTKPKTTVKPAIQKPVLKTFKDSVSYACGLSFANFYKSQGVTSINTTILSRAVNDVLSGKNIAFSDEIANKIMNRYMFQLQAEKVKPTIDAGKKFLADNKKRTGVKTTESGLQYEVITEGTGEKPTINDTVICNYRGSFIDGNVFESSFEGDKPISFSLRGVIKGWTEGLQLMPVGSKYKFYIPYNLAYGEFENGPIPGGSTLVFEVELLGIKKSAEQ